MLSELEIQANLSAIKYAVCRKIFCECGRILDQDHATLMLYNGKAAVSCTECADRTLARIARKAKRSPAEVVRQIREDGGSWDCARDLRKLRAHVRAHGGR